MHVVPEPVFNVAIWDMFTLVSIDNCLPEKVMISVQFTWARIEKFLPEPAVEVNYLVVSEHILVLTHVPDRYIN